MPKWFTPAAMVCGLMFAPSPLLIANAPYESTMGLVQKIFYVHLPSAWMFLLAAIVCGIASVRYLFRGNPRHDRLAWAAAELVVLFGIITLVTGPLWATEGVGRLVAVGRAADLEPDGMDGSGRLPAAAEVRRPRLGQAGRRPGAVRDGERAVHLHLGELLAHDPSDHERRADAAGIDGTAALVQRSPTFLLLFLLLLRMRIRLEEQRARLDALYLVRGCITMMTETSLCGDCPDDRGCLAMPLGAQQHAAARTAG